jgi:hypothetical protein
MVVSTIFKVMLKMSLSSDVDGIPFVKHNVISKETMATGCATGKFFQVEPKLLKTKQVHINSK